VEQANNRKQGRGWHQRFAGFHPRKNCEAVPVIPARIVQNHLMNPAGTSSLLIWRSRRSEAVVEAVRVANCYDSHGIRVGSLVELERVDAGTSILSTVWRPSPRRGGRVLLLICGVCKKPRRFIYCNCGTWKCRSCAGLRYSSEGRGLWSGVRFLRAFGPLPRPEPWYPEVLHLAGLVCVHSRLRLPVLLDS